MINNKMRDFIQKYTKIFTVLKHGRLVADQLEKLPDLVDKGYEDLLNSLKDKRDRGLDERVYAARKAVLEEELKRYDAERGAISMDEFKKLLPPFNEESAVSLENYPDFSLRFPDAPEWCYYKNRWIIWHEITYLYKGKRRDTAVRQGRFEYAERQWVHAFCDELRLRDDAGERYAPVLDLFNMSGASVLEIRFPLKNFAKELADIGLISHRDSCLFVRNPLTNMALEYLAGAGYLTRKS